MKKIYDVFNNSIYREQEFLDQQREDIFEKLSKIELIIENNEYINSLKKGKLQIKLVTAIAILNVLATAIFISSIPIIMAYIIPLVSAIIVITNLKFIKKTNSAISMVSDLQIELLESDTVFKELLEKYKSLKPDFSKKNIVDEIDLKLIKDNFTEILDVNYEREETICSVPIEDCLDSEELVIESSPKRLSYTKKTD
ncbi:MAG: hypothetical protein R3Y21_03020 [Mycoplasmatota bacterium]